MTSGSKLRHWDGHRILVFIGVYRELGLLSRDIKICTCMEAHMALQKLTTTKVMMVSHCSLVKEDIL